MNEKLTFTGGEPTINFDDLDRNNKANKDALIDSFRVNGDNYIIQGVTGDPSITAGYVMLDGEILQVDAHAKSGTHFVKVTTYDAAGDKTFNDLTPRQTWAKHRATITAGSGSLAYASANRLPSMFDVSGGLLTEVIEIGSWDMVATQTVNVAHGLTASKIRGFVSILIIDDSGVPYDFVSPTYAGSTAIGNAEGGMYINGVNVVMTRRTTGLFNAVAPGRTFQSTGVNRGYITLNYVA